MKEESLILTDMHAHLPGPLRPGKAEELLPGKSISGKAERELLFRKSHGIRTCFSAGTPGEWEYLNLLDVKGAGMEISFGIHPWYSDKWEPEEWLDIYRQCPVIGEIGMDSLWCSVPIERQRKVFETQLRIAADLNKPILLHTKDREGDIADIIRDFPCPVIVHWYSGNETDLKKFIDLDCFFTLGPDVSFAPGGLLPGSIPLDRLLTETDGTEAIKWAYNEHGIRCESITGADDPKLICKTLTAEINCLAVRSGMDQGTVSHRISSVFSSFFMLS